jgi:hypothetical protein
MILTKFTIDTTPGLAEKILLAIQTQKSSVGVGA